MKKFFKKIGDWFKRHKPTKRRIIQLYAALLTNANLKGFKTGKIYTGGSKNMCVPGLNCYSCPGAIGSCPLGALQNALAQSGTRLPFYIFGIIILFGLILGRTICGFLCPFGLIQELVYKIKTPKLKKSKATRVLSYLKYVVLVVFVVALPLTYAAGALPLPAFCKYICPSGTLLGAIGLLSNPSNEAYLPMLGSLFTWKFSLMIAILVASVFIFRAFCRFLCPLGAIYGFFSKISLLGIKLDKNKCTDCGLCVAHCKLDIKRVGDHECVQCGECIDVCPAKAISWKGSKLFVHPNAEEIPAPVEPPRPLGAFLKSSAEGAQPNEGSAQPTEQENATGQAVDAVAEVPVSTPSASKRARKIKWISLAAWGVALIVLISALVYYNFIHEEPAPTPPPGTDGIGHEVGNLCPDFTLSVYNEDGTTGTYSLSQGEGKVVILNFWTTYCTPCVGEIPHFLKVASDYQDQVDVAIIHGKGVVEDVYSYIYEIKEWGGTPAYFLQDTAEVDLYAQLQGGNVWPVTVIVDEEGTILYRRLGSVQEGDLERLLDAYFQTGEMPQE
ncbi:MAG: 4Fe-4S binding protein [Clostridia bacterium]|nr:4Fe-4S binding protein [Clostridia bacterium]